MKKISDYRRLLSVTEQAGLKELKTAYRDLMKEFHPDKFQDDEEGKLAAEDKSKQIIEAYHFLVSIAPETRAETLAEYNQTINLSTIVDYEYKSLVLKIEFLDGNTYEYFNVPKSIYVKLVNSDSKGRFARRHIYNSFVYRSVNKVTKAVPA